MNKKRHENGCASSLGFTLLEILIALFIFTILSLMMASGLRTVIDAQSATEKNAERLHQLQMVLLEMSRDIEQAIDRPVTNAFGNAEPSFVGAANGFTFTCMGLANPLGNITRSTMQRERFYTDGGSMLRAVWRVLDQAPQTRPMTRTLMTDLGEARFQYLGEDGRFYNAWPVVEQAKQPLPRAVRVFLSIPQWGRMSQLYVISARPNKTI